MTDSVDEYTVQHLTEFEGKRLINASREVQSPVISPSPPPVSL